MKPPKKFVGKLRVIETELWDSDALDMIVPAHATFDVNGARLCDEPGRTFR